MILIEYPDRDVLMSELAHRISLELGAALGNGPVSLAVPGGTTPGPMFDALSKASIDWARVRVMLTDERQVPADHERSNERLLRERLLVNAAADAEFLRLVPEAEDDMPALCETLDTVLPLTVLLLGMGTDMHTASLFPGSPDLAAALADDAPPLMGVEASGDLEDRLTLTAPALVSALSPHILITGDEKRAALEKAQELTAEEAPVSIVLKRATVHWAP